MEKLILIGAGGHCKVAADILKGQYEIIGTTDPDINKHGIMYYGIPVLGGDDRLEALYREGIHNAFITLGSIGNPSIRKRLFEKALSIGFHIVNAISPHAILSPSVKMGRGNLVAEGAIIHADTCIGNNTIINTAAIIEHDCIIGDHAHISPGAKLAGGVTIGTGAHIGIGAVIIQGIRIGANCIIGAGAAVIKDVPDGATAVGVPARIIKRI